MNSHGIASIFPPFGQEHVNRFRTESSTAEKHALNFMFQVADIRYPKQSEHVVSTSLYCQPHDPEKPRIHPVTVDELRKPHPGVRNGSSWWAEYMVPLIRNLDRVPSPWTIRIHLAPDLVFLERFLKHPRVEFRIMSHISENTIPGMLWRYLPIDDQVTVMARGADAFWPDPAAMKKVTEMLEGPAVLFRRFLPRDCDASRTFIYRTIPGPIVLKGGSGLNFSEAAKAWIWHQMHSRWPVTVQLPGEEQPVKKFGLSHWARYGQDEQFLSHWLYYQVAPRGISTVIDKSHSSQVWHLDEAYVASASAHSVICQL